MQFPPSLVFQTDLTNERISKEDYEYAQNVWQKFDLTSKI